MKYIHLIFSVCLFFGGNNVSAQTTKDSILNHLTGCWTWDYYTGGFAGLPPTPAWKHVHLQFNRDAQDSLAQTISFRLFEDSVLTDSGRVALDNTPPLFYANGYELTPDVLNGLGIGSMSSVHFMFKNDSLEMAYEVSDGFQYTFGRAVCLQEIDSAVSKIDSVIQALTGCWRWDNYFGGFIGLPPTPAWWNVRLQCGQTAQDSLAQTITCSAYLDDTLKFSGTCQVGVNSLNTLSCPLFDSIGIVGSPPLYFYFENDTLLFPQEQWVDGYVYVFLKTCEPDDTINHVKELDAFDITLFPNPASNRFFISLKTQEPIALDIFNSTGQLLKIFTAEHSTRYEMDVSEIPEGIYFIRLQSDSKVLIKKLFVAR